MLFLDRAGLMAKIDIKIHVSKQRFPNVAGHWLVAVLPANQKAGLKTQVFKFVVI